MSDYLANLTAKALNPMQGIQPRLASLFEPPSAAGRTMAAGLSANGEAAPGEPFSGGPSFEGPLSTQESSSHAWQSRPPSTGPRRPVTTLPQQPTSMTDTFMDQLPGQGVKTPAASSSSGATSGQLPADLVPSHQDTPSLVAVSAAQATAAVPSTHTAKQESLSALEQIIGRVVDERAVLFDVPQSQDVTHPESVSDHARRASTPAMTVVQPHVTLYREPPVSIPSEVTARLEPAPTIRITIGRVDVRAIMPAVPAPRPAPKRSSPALSLEDYLKQRGGGRQ
jgi:hypothetical protein